jgi:hypothetical protein
LVLHLGVYMDTSPPYFADEVVGVFVRFSCLLVVTGAP